MSENSAINPAWFISRDYVAIVLREYLRPAAGYDTPIFPPTFAMRPTLQQRHPYNIDVLRNEGSNICLIDSVASQANRLEPIFDEFDPRVVRKVTVKVTSGKKKEDQTRSLLQIGHRVADAVVRFSDKADQVAKALKEHEDGNSIALAKDFATSLVFGAWNSRDAGEKVPRVFQSTIRATDVEPLTRASQYVPPFNYKALLDDRDGRIIDPKTPDKKLSNVGLLAVPVVTMKTKEKNKDLAFRVHGGVLVNGDIRRDASINLVNVRALRAGGSKEIANDALRSYVFGLSLVALLYDQELSLRQDCQLVLDPQRAERRAKDADAEGRAYGRPGLALVTRDGKEAPLAITYAEAKRFAENAARSIGIEQSELVITFEPSKMKAGIKAAGADDTEEED